MVKSLQRWLRVSLLNLLIVAAIGVVLRYKIAFSLPFINQKHLLEGHSHFAFTGWISQTLMVLLVHSLCTQTGADYFKRYRGALYFNLIAAYGMLITFPVEGYGLYSIIFANLSILASWYFAILYWKDLTMLPVKNESARWYKSSLLFNVISSAGAFALAFMMAAKNHHQNWYLSSIYFFLHFQYNGWFFFACIGLFIERFFKKEDSKELRKIFLPFISACIPAFFLSALWLPIPLWAYILIVAAAIAQLIGWLWMIKLIRKGMGNHQTLVTSTAGKLLLLPAIALSIKLLLQAGSTIPSLSNLAFGFRPIVIGYLHLVLLGFVSLFLLLYMVVWLPIKVTQQTKNGIFVLTAGIILNELLLLIQGCFDLRYTAVPYINEMLLFAACVLFTGIAILNASQRKKLKTDLNHKQETSDK